MCALNYIFELSFELKYSQLLPICVIMVRTDRSKTMAKTPIDKKVESLFEDKEEREGKIRCSLYLKEGVHSKVVEAAKKSGNSMNSVIERIIEKFFENK